MATRCMAPRHAGHGVETGPASTRALRAPHCGQNAVPWNISPKHCGQLIVASRARQYGQRLAVESALAPQFGQ
jgi:hypothetical protein